MSEERIALIASALALLVALSSLLLPGEEMKYTPGTPMRRSVERVHKKTSPEPGPFWSAGYSTYLKEVAIEDLFAVQNPGDPTMNEATARFTHVERLEEACHMYTIPTDFYRPPLVTPGTGPGGLLDYPVLTTTVRARQRIFYDAQPSARSWDKIDDFQRGVEIAVYDLVDETDAIDPLEGVATGALVAYLRKSAPVRLPSGRSFDFAEYGDRLYAEFQFQTKPVPMITPVAGLTTAAPAGTPPAVSRFRDSGVWLTMPAVGAVPTPGVGPCPTPRS